MPEPAEDLRAAERTAAGRRTRRCPVSCFLSWTATTSHVNACRSRRLVSCMTARTHALMDWAPSTHRLLRASYAPPESPFNPAAA